MFEFCKGYCHHSSFDLSVVKKRMGHETDTVCVYKLTHLIVHSPTYPLPTCTLICKPIYNILSYPLTHLMGDQHLNSIAHVTDAKGDYELIVPLKNVDSNTHQYLLYSNLSYCTNPKDSPCRVDFCATG